MLKKWIFFLGLCASVITSLQAHQNRSLCKEKKFYIDIENIALTPDGIVVFSSVFGAEVLVSSVNRDNCGYYITPNSTSYWRCPRCSKEYTDGSSPMAGCGKCGWKPENKWPI
ncbi:MAG: hypothetical protein ACOYK9_02160 [Chlamydiia bacterium]